MEGDELKKLKSYIQSQLQKGYEIEIVRDSLIEAGFPKSDVNAAIDSLVEKKKITPPEKKPIFSGLFKKQPKKIEIPKAKIEIPEIKEEKTPIKIPSAPKERDYKEHSRPRLWIFGLLAVLLIVLVVFGLAYVAPTNCTTEECFVSKANNCMAATYTNQIEGTTFYYETNNCVLRKTVQDMDPGEPQTVVNAFLGKSMRCKFNKNDFSPLLINSVTGYLEACEGPLKDSILRFVG